MLAASSVLVSQYGRASSPSIGELGDLAAPAPRAGRAGLGRRVVRWSTRDGGPCVAGARQVVVVGWSGLPHRGSHGRHADPLPLITRFTMRVQCIYQE